MVAQRTESPTRTSATASMGRPTVAHWERGAPRDSPGGSGGIMGIVDKIKRSLPIVGGGEAPRTTMPPRPAPQASAAAPKAEGSIHDFIDGMVKGNKLFLFIKGSPRAPPGGRVR